MARAVLNVRADASETDDHELSELVENVLVRGQKVRGLRRRALVAVSLGAAALCGVALKHRLAPCAPPLGDASVVFLVSLVEAYPADIVGLSAVSARPDALLQWLAAANGVGNAASKAAGGQTSSDLAKAANEAIHKALQGGDPKVAEKLAENLMRKAAERNQKNREELHKFAKNLGGGKLRGEKSVSQQVSDATCVFDVLSLTTGFATLATNINDVSRTCEGVDVEELFSAKSKHVHGKVCAVNLAAMLAGFASLATNIATSTDECAQTLIPNVDALCSAAITGLLTATSAFGGSFTLIAAACREQGWYGQIPAGITPANMGSNKLWREMREEGPAAAAAAADAPSAPVRKLLFGGGKEALATQCITEIMSIAWSLADLGLTIDSMANKDMKPACPPTNLMGGTAFKGPVYKIKQQLCTVDVGSALVAFFGVITMGQLVAVTCTDTINLGAICGSGITGSFTAAAGIVKTAAGMALTCDLAQKPVLHDLITMARKIDIASGYKISDLIDSGLGGSSAVGARRLTSDERMAELKAKYGTPAGVWKSLGWDIEDPNAPWRGGPGSEPAPIHDDYFRAIVEEVEGTEKAPVALFGQRQCRA